MKFLFGKNKAKQAKVSIDKMAEQQDVDGLGDALMDPDWQIREYAAEAIERVGIPDDPSIQARYLVVKKNFNEVLPLGNIARDPLVLALVHSNPKTQYDASDTLIKIFSVDAVQPIIDAIPVMDPRYVSNIALLLGKFTDSVTADKLITALESPDAYVRWVSVYALGEMGDSRALSKLEEMIQKDKGKTTENGPVKAAARIAFEKVQWRNRPTGQLIDALGDSDEYIRFGAVDALGRRGEVTSVSRLINLLGDPSHLVRENVITALGKIGDTRAISPLTTIASSKNEGMFRWMAINSIEAISGTPVDMFIEMLNDPDDRFTAVVRLGRSNDPRAIDALRRILKEEQNEGIKNIAKESIDEIQQRINENK
ncbi:MAG TPA: HEAT repeat domain-containing protein [Anaerolineales bacterium]|nr:HEAT repeat domain-containing protein [Anaerolineales bacterium]